MKPEEPAEPAGEAGEGEAFWSPDDHDDTGLDLARAAAKAIAGAAINAPRAKRRRKPGGQGDRRGRTRGSGKRASGAHPDERDPQALDLTLGRLVSDQGWALDLRVHTVFGSWGSIVGDEVAQHCFPTSFVDGRLTVRTDSTAWATQLRLLAPTVVRRLNEELGHGAVTIIEVEGPNLPTWKKGRLNSRDGRGPRDTYG
ncbi:MAG: DciA family protein [Nocardioides sp.]|nr:DciA family protein [Nocardioides sp.]